MSNWAEMARRQVPWPQVRRFAKFGTVGASGVLVNLAILYLGNEWLFRSITVAEWRLNASLGLAILLATLNNFLWNWAWTWQDRKQAFSRPGLAQFGQYVAACGIGIALQVALTKLLAPYCHYLLANVVAIGFASLSNFIANDWVTFQFRRKGQA